MGKARPLTLSLSPRERKSRRQSCVSLGTLRTSEVGRWCSRIIYQRLHQLRIIVVADGGGVDAVRERSGGADAQTEWRTPLGGEQAFAGLPHGVAPDDGPGRVRAD